MDERAGGADEPNAQEPASGKDPGDVTVRRHHYGSHDELRHHLQLCLDAYNHARRLKTLHGLASYEFISKTWVEPPAKFTVDPADYNLAPNI